MDEEFVKDLVKFYVLRYAITMIVSRTTTGKHKEARVQVATADAIEAAVDVLRDYRGRYIYENLLLKEIAERIGFKATIRKDEIIIRIPGRRGQVDPEKFERTVNYALTACRDFFGLIELVKRPGRTDPERYVRPNRGELVARRFSELATRLEGIAEYASEYGAYICRNPECSVLELYTPREAEQSDYVCKGKLLVGFETGEASYIERRAQGCGRPLEPIETDLFEKRLALVNAIIEELSRSPRA